MASLNPLTREVVFKIVFYGPGLGGKTTTLQHIHAASKPEHRGKLVSLATPMDRTLYFDFLPLRLPLMRGMNVRLQLFTVPGQVYFAATRKLVLTGADGVVFVADSQPGRQEANQESIEDLVMNLAENNLALLSLPHTFHWNKRDLPDVLPIPDLERTLNRQGAPSLGTVATQGEGVFPGLERITRLVLQAYEADLPKSEQEPNSRPPLERAPMEETTIADALRGLAEAPLRAAATPTESMVAPKPSATSSWSQSVTASSLESIPNPIPRRSSGALDAPMPGASPMGHVAPPSRRAPASRSSGHPTPIPPGEPHLTGRPAKTVTPPAPRVTISPPSQNGQAIEGLSFYALWAEEVRDTARQVEAALAGGESADAVLLCEGLVTRLLASAEGPTAKGEASRDPALVLLLLGLDGRRYLVLQAWARAARAHEETSQLDALEAYAFALEVRRATASLQR